MSIINQSRETAGSYNVGPEEKDYITVGKLANLFCKTWNEQTDCMVRCVNVHDGGPHEAGYLKQDCSKLKKFQWKPKWDIGRTIKKSVELYCKIETGSHKVRECLERQIESYG